ncbi:MULTISPECIES: hypothetical protein [unclassified Aurantimonas]|uniref:hypothetical protein n=1 Tax=unclassified Aurantimonas TaxID=2638230 RepID=UPI002E18B944|nr:MULTISPECIES: hypothetical protein [unclassified Aurantimonas]MEC5289427.1 hypothetical protein [Aurantimonas sp. C2-3-R2]MEC5410507.1 hypothetical protein [Aurantimonas sp. C2-4-R8]
MSDPEPMGEGEYERLVNRIQTWNGERNRPRFSHWTNRGTFAIEAHSAGLTRVTFNGEELGFGSQWPSSVAIDIVDGGAYDREAQKVSEDPTLTAASIGVPPNVRYWNNLG